MGDESSIKKEKGGHSWERMVNPAGEMIQGEILDEWKGRFKKENAGLKRTG